jgi:hypothetical protein
MADLRDAVMRIVAECAAVPLDVLGLIRRESWQDLKLDGDDVEEIIERIAATYMIDMSAVPVGPPPWPGRLQTRFGSSSDRPGCANH